MKTVQVQKGGDEHADGKGSNGEEAGLNTVPFFLAEKAGKEKRAGGITGAY